jgi:hypothetical protein
MSPPAILQAKKPVMAVPTIIAEPGRMPPGHARCRGRRARRWPGWRAWGCRRPIRAERGPECRRDAAGMGMGMPTPDPAAAMRPAAWAADAAARHVQPLATPTGRPAWMDRMGPAEGPRCRRAPGGWSSSPWRR